MSVTMVPNSHFTKPKTAQVLGNFSPKRPKFRQNRSEVRCCSKRVEEGTVREKNYYDVLGVSADSNAQQIKEAYRTLQKQYHPDIAGQKGHEYTLMLNQAYKVLMREDLRKNYDASIGKVRVQFGKSTSGLGYSSWNGPLRPQALFVDENACIGCRECVHHAGKTFVMDDSLGCARVKVQYGDNDQNLEVSVDSCPVNCIYWVDSEELAVLEFLVQPQQKDGYGVFGGGWERPANVFMAAKSFSKQLRQRSPTTHDPRYGQTTVEEETPAQAEARASAARRIKMERFSKFWNFVKEVFGSNL